MFIKYCGFPKNVVIFLNSASSAATLLFDLPLRHPLTTRGNRERPESGIYFKIFEKTQYLMNILYLQKNNLKGTLNASFTWWMDFESNLSFFNSDQSIADSVSFNFRRAKMVQSLRPRFSNFLFFSTLLCSKRAESRVLSASQIPIYTISEERKKKYTSKKSHVLALSKSNFWTLQSSHLYALVIRDPYSLPDLLKLLQQIRQWLRTLCMNNSANLKNQE